jgi:hypothetical protein
MMNTRESGSSFRLKTFSGVNGARISDGSRKVEIAIKVVFYKTAVLHFALHKFGIGKRCSTKRAIHKAAGDEICVRK